MRKLDLQVATKIMGFGSPSEDPPQYSDEMASAMKVFDRMREMGHRWLLNADEAGFHLRNVGCVRFDLDRNEKVYTCDRPLGTAKTLADLPRVICEAALKEQETALENSN